MALRRQQEAEAKKNLPTISISDYDEVRNEKSHFNGQQNISNYVQKSMMNPQNNYKGILLTHKNALFSSRILNFNKKKTQK